MRCEISFAGLASAAAAFASDLAAEEPLAVAEELLDDEGPAPSVVLLDPPSPETIILDSSRFTSSIDVFLASSTSAIFSIISFLVSTSSAMASFVSSVCSLTASFSAITFSSSATAAWNDLIDASKSFSIK
uniref:Putative secreted protein n=1 Tax=Anopheles marajoara TaxID=58244 RepID=A0A2M4C6W5_9DIPT